MEKRKQLELPKELMEPDWKTNKVVIKTMTLGENMRIRDEATSVAMTKTGGTASISQEVAVIEKINKSVVEAPWKVNDRKTIADLDNAVGEWLLAEIQEFQQIPEKKKET